MKKLYIFLLIFISLMQANAWRYSDQKKTYFYTIDLPDYPSSWKLIDDASAYNALFQSQDAKASAEVTIFDLNKVKDNNELLKIMATKFNMTGESSKVTFCKYSALKGIYDFNYNGVDLKMDLVVFRDNYFYYTVMAYCYKNSYEKYKNDLEAILNSLKIYYDNNVVYSNENNSDTNNNLISNSDVKTNQKLESSQKLKSSNNNKNKLVEQNPSDNSTYAFHIKWEKNNKVFKFLEDDLIKSKNELNAIGSYTGNSWNGWKYYNIDTENDSDYNFTFWKTFYQDQYNKNYYRVNDVVNYFNELSKSGDYSAYQLAQSIMKCIQVITYERPKNLIDKNSGIGILDFFSPNLIADYQKGDCDTKSLFMVIILRRLGFDAVMFHSSHYSHAMVGLNINASGYYLTYNSKKYYFIESTYPGWDIGDIPPEMKDTSKWRVVPIK